MGYIPYLAHYILKILNIYIGFADKCFDLWLVVINMLDLCQTTGIGVHRWYVFWYTEVHGRHVFKKFVYSVFVIKTQIKTICDLF
jgi:hypothetical protein